MTYVPTWPGLRPRHALPLRARGPLPFPLGASGASYAYLARNLLYHLARALRGAGVESVLAPDYHHGNEIRAIRAAGARVVFYPVRRDLTVDLDALRRLVRSGPHAVLVIHYLGWAQPIEAIARLCREHGRILIEDCALSLLSETAGGPLGSFGDYGVFCLYKTVPVPNGAVAVRNGTRGPALDHPCRAQAGPLSVSGRCLELALEWSRSRIDAPGRALAALKRAAGRELTALGLPRTPVGDSGFDAGAVELGMSPVSHRLLRRFDYDGIRRRRRRNYLSLRTALEGRAMFLDLELEDGVCPLFFPLLVEDKAAMASALRARGIGAVEFWNEGAPGAEEARASDAAFLRRHVLELPVHQDLTASHVRYMADAVLLLHGSGGRDRRAAVRSTA